HPGKANVVADALSRKSGMIAGLPQTQRRHDAIWEVVDRLTKSAHFLHIRKDYSVSRLAKIFQQEIVRLHGIIKMEPDIKNMTLNEYLEYEAVKEMRLWDNVQSKSSPTRNERADFNFSHRDKKVIQPLIPQPIHTTPPNDDYVAPATKSILDKLLDEFRDEIMNVTMGDKEVHSVITKPEPFIHTQPISPVYGIFKSYKSSTKLYKVDREMKSPFRDEIMNVTMGDKEVDSNPTKGIEELEDFSLKILSHILQKYRF
nr:retrotransposon protein [Tanacetum cinerariifolium]